VKDIYYYGAKINGFGIPRAKPPVKPLVFTPQGLEEGLEDIAILPPVNVKMGDGSKKSKSFRKFRKGASRWRKNIFGN
jgi:hypothetical protein